MTKTQRGTLEMSSAMIILGTIGWFVIRSGQPVMNVVFWRCVFGGLTLLIICAGMGLLRRITLRQAGIAVLGGVAIVLNWLLLFEAYNHASISIATALYNTQPFMLIGFGTLFFGEKLALSKFAWLGVAFVGLLFIVQAKPDASYLSPNYPLGIVMALGAAFFWAVAAVITKKLVAVPPHLIALIQVGVGVVMLIPFAEFSNLPQSASAWGMLVTVGVVHTGLMYILMYSAVQKLPTHLQGSLSFLYPVVAILVDVLALGHTLHMTQFLGVIAILLAAAGMSLGWLWQRLPRLFSK